MKQMIDLVNSFPVIAKRYGGGIPEWNSDYITREDGLLAYYLMLSSGGRAVIEFALLVWNWDTDWKVYGFQDFNLAHAFAFWDEGQREAFRAWTRDPFFP